MPGTFLVIDDHESVRGALKRSLEYQGVGHGFLKRR